MTMHPDRLLLFLILNETALITQRLDSIVSDQDQLNADVAEEATLLTTMEKEITSLKAQPNAAGIDFSGVDSLLTRFRGDAASAAPAPAGAPADHPAPPAGGVPAAPASPAPAGQASGPATGDSIPAPGAPSAAAPAEAAPAATTPSGLTPPATGATPA